MHERFSNYGDWESESWKIRLLKLCLIFFPFFAFDEPGKLLMGLSTAIFRKIMSQSEDGKYLRFRDFSLDNYSILTNGGNFSRCTFRD